MMERLTFEGNFCDIAQCRENPCPYNGSCSQREVWERLKQFEDTRLTPQDCAEYRKFEDEIIASGKTFGRLVDLLKADKEGRVVVLPSNKALTNADRMRTATNQQLAKLLYDNQKEFCRLMYKNLGFEDVLEFSEDYSDILAWLNTSEKAEKALEAEPMDEYIKREVVREVMYHNQEPLTEYQLNDIPGADVAPVVRCKDCKYFNNAAPNDKGFCICPASNMEIVPDDFCSYGERKETDHGEENE